MLTAAAEEERFTRIKHDSDFPQNAIDFCLDHANVTGKDLDYVVFFEKPFLKFDRLLRTSLQTFPSGFPMFVQSMKSWFLDKLWVKSLIGRSLGIEPSRILFSEHHLSHAASAYFCSPFDESAVVTFDGVGEWATTTIGVGRGTDLAITRELDFPHSIGLLYSAFTAFLGFEVNEGEYKVMGMAPYGMPVYIDEIRKMIHLDDDCAFWLDPGYFSFHHSTKSSYSRKFLDLFGEPRDSRVPFFTASSGFPTYYGSTPPNIDELRRYNQRYADIAASLQAVTEEVILRIVREAHRETGSSRLCLAGGVALNSVANGRILRETPFEELYVPPSVGDGGAALGAALVGWHCFEGQQSRFVMDHAQWGQSYGPDDIRAALSETGLTGTYVYDEADLVGATVDRLLQGKVVGWFQGRFEWGPRALGNRSILADPRDPGMKDVINTKIKFREPFRPFAPSVLNEASEQYFDIADPERQMSTRFMSLVVPVRDDERQTIPAVDHMGTARVQTVDEQTNPLYYDLIETFGDATGVPVLLNTSFNVRGEPIVNAPHEALDTFTKSGIDTLVMGNHIVDKE